MAVVIVVMCIGKMSVFAADPYVIKKGSNIELLRTGTAPKKYATISDVKYAEIVGGNYIFSSITNNLHANGNYVKTLVRYKNIWGKWYDLGEVTVNMPNVGAVYSPRYNYGGNLRVYGLDFYVSNKFATTEKEYKNTANCKTSLTQAFLFSD